MAFHIVQPSDGLKSHYEVVVIGSGFGSSFFLHEALKRTAGRILVIEWGDNRDHQWQLENQRNSDIAPGDTFTTRDDKLWNFTIGLGGGTNCWFGQTPRLHPNDFRLKSRYGVGQDWPFSYDELEPFYGQAEEIMEISGDPDMAVILPRSTPFPQPPHRGSAIDRLMKSAQPDRHFIVPTARARVATATRGACCVSGVCNLCPVDAKFSAYNGFQHVYGDPRVDICVKSKALHFQWQNDTVQGVVFEHAGRHHTVKGDLFVLGASSMQSPYIMLRSGMDGPKVGKGLHEQIGVNIEVFLDGLENFDGSTRTTGLNYSLYDGDFRREAASALICFENRWMQGQGLRSEFGRWRQTLPMHIIVEDLVMDRTFVSLPGHGDVPQIVYPAPSDYAKRGIDRAMSLLPEVLAPLPVESINFRKWRATESHMQGTLRMGTGPEDSVVDRDLLHHRWRNLAVVGTSVFPTCAGGNPSLTAAALSLWSAGRILPGRKLPGKVMVGKNS
jgi:choline dehydrogenase-like flavoprotein